MLPLQDVLKEKEIGEGAKEWASARGGSAAWDGNIYLSSLSIGLSDGNIGQQDNCFCSQKITPGSHHACPGLSEGPSGQGRHRIFNTEDESVLIWFSPDKSATYPCEWKNKRIPIFAKVFDQGIFSIHDLFIITPPGKIQLCEHDSLAHSDSCSESAGDIAQYVFDNWPEEWKEEAVSKAEILRLIYQVRSHEKWSFKLISV